MTTGHTDEPCKNGRIDRDAVWGGQTRVGPRKTVLGGRLGGADPPREGHLNAGEGTYPEVL